MSDVAILQELVGTELRRPNGRTEIQIFNPATEELIARAPEADFEVVMEATIAAREAFDRGPWPQMHGSERAELLEQVAMLLEENLDAFARAETSDTGMTLKMTSQGHLPRAIAHLRYFAGEAVRSAGECFPMDSSFLQFVQREPLGVVAILAPWNAPLAVATINAAAALALGNTIIIKSSERAPVTMAMLAEIFAAVGFPAGVVNIIHGRGIVTGSALVQSSTIDSLCFVGGTDTARSILSHSGLQFRRNTLELGGKSPTIILEDASIEDAIDGALLSVFSSNGEVCTAGSRILIHDSIYDKFVDIFCKRASAIRIGDPHEPETEIGPLIDAPHLKSIEEWVMRGVAEGAKLACGGNRPSHLPVGHYFSPTLLTGVNHRAMIAQEEVFGPIACAISFHNEEEAIAIANDTKYGLSATVWCANTSRGMAIARKLRCGVVAVNSPVIRDIRVPFGGYRASGLGRVGGRWSLDQYSETKTTCIPIDGLTLPRLGIG
jgi:acyl-CoA reductase-like NAD-dependent aldehyde dehydrogenase